MVERRLQKIEGVEGFVARTGRAELDEHIIGVNMTEIIVNFSPRWRPEPRGGPRRDPRGHGRHPGIVTSAEQPLAHLISAMLSGVQSQVAVKLYGDDLDVLRAKAQESRPPSRECRASPTSWSNPRFSFRNCASNSTGGNWPATD